MIHSLSIFILCLFLVEVAAKLYAYRLRFFYHKLEVFDAIVVIVSFGLDVAYQDPESSARGAGLIIVLRLWRVARLLNGELPRGLHRGSKPFSNLRKIILFAQGRKTVTRV